MRSALIARVFIFGIAQMPAPTTSDYCQRRGQQYYAERAKRRASYLPKRETWRGRVAEDGTNTAHDAARAMLDSFASVGATRFDVTWTNNAGQPKRFREGVRLADLTRAIPAILIEATGKERNVIVRPHGPGVTFIQLDDLTADKLPTIAPAMFLTLETSPGSFQAWLAMAGDDDKEFARRVRRGAKADLSASGATRIAGSLNFKDKYAPNFPRVAIHEAHAGCRTTADELERLGLVAPKDDFAPLPPARPKASNSGKWPSYAVCLKGAPLNRDGTGPDRSKADFVFCMTAITWGFSVKETAERLLEESSKAREMEARSEGYADLTARNAALAVERRRPGRQKTAQHG
jgi:hypothetical protein